MSTEEKFNEVGSKEGWMLANTDEIDSPYQLQRLDENAKFEDDAEVWGLFARKIDNGSVLHQDVLEFLAEESPDEYNLIKDYMKEVE